MKTEQLQQPGPLFPQIVSIALDRLKKRLQHGYQKAYPDLGEIIELVLDEEEAKAREISLFPHLILPDLADTHFAKLGLRPAETRHETPGFSQDFTTTAMPKTALASCG